MNLNLSVASAVTPICLCIYIQFKVLILKEALERAVLCNSVFCWSSPKSSVCPFYFLTSNIVYNVVFCFFFFNHRSKQNQRVKTQNIPNRNCEQKARGQIYFGLKYLFLESNAYSYFSERVSKRGHYPQPNNVSDLLGLRRPKLSSFSVTPSRAALCNLCQLVGSKEENMCFLFLRKCFHYQAYKGIFHFLCSFT